MREDEYNRLHSINYAAFENKVQELLLGKHFGKFGMKIRCLLIFFRNS